MHLKLMNTSKHNKASGLMGAIAFLILLLGIHVPAWAQEAPKSKNPKKQGQYYLQLKEYGKALELLRNYHNADPKNAQDAELKFDIGKCYFYLDSLERSAKFFRFIIETGQAPAETYLYMAQIHHWQLKLNAAAQYYKRYLKSLDRKNPERIAIKRNILQCMAAKEVVKTKLEGASNPSNLSALNSSYDDWAPLKESDGNLYFNSRRESATGGYTNDEGKADAFKGNYKSDIYRSKIAAGGWASPEQAGSLLNTFQEDVLLDFTENGDSIFCWRGMGRRGDIIRLPNAWDSIATEEIEPQVFPPFHSERLHRTNAVFAFGGNLILFSAERPGGYGGLDIYYSHRDPETEQWTEPENIGPAINTPADESWPFLAKNGRTLYYSSNSEQSMGGFDIFSSTFVDSLQIWPEGKNLGTPLNSAADEISFRLSPMGDAAYLSSNKPGGKGGLDIYSMFFRNPREEQQDGTNPIAAFNLVNDSTFALVKQYKQQNVQPIVPQQASRPKVTLEPLYLSSEGTIAPRSQQSLQNLVAFLNQYPKAFITLTSHADTARSPIEKLYETAKNAETVWYLLRGLGVKPGRAYIRGAGNFAPIAQNTESNLRLNRRVDILVTNPAQLPVDVVYSQPEQPTMGQDGRWTSFQKQSQGLSYKLQIVASSNRCDDLLLGNSPFPLCESVPESNIYRYTVGMFKTYAEAKSYQKILSGRGYKKAVIFPYLEGTRIDKPNDYVKQFPDLNAYIKGK